MNALKKHCLLHATPVALILLTSVARAQTTPLTVTLNPTAATVAALAGTDQTVTFIGTLTNTSSTPLYLNTDEFNVDSPLSLDDSSFFNTFIFPTDSSGDLLPQPTLAGNSSLTMPLFSVFIPAGTAAGGYNGSFEIQGGDDPSEYSLLSATGFNVSAVQGAAVAPEPSTPTILVVGLAVLGGLAARKRRSTASGG